MKASTQLSQAARVWAGRLGRRSIGVAGAVAAAAIVLLALSARTRSAQAFSSYLDAFRAQYPAAAGSKLDSCVLCHVSGTSGGPLNAYGSAYGSNGHSFSAIQNLDSDGDGFTNAAEIAALTFPGNAADKPAQPTATSPAPTATAPVPTATSSATSPAPTATPVGPSPTATVTLPPGSATPTATAATPPSDGLDLDIRAFTVSEEVTLDEGKDERVRLRLEIKNSGKAGGQGSATVVGVQNGVQVYSVSLAVSATRSRRGRYYSTSYTLPSYLPSASGTITWTAALTDGNPDDDTATATTQVSAGEASDGGSSDDSAHERDNRPAQSGGNAGGESAAQPVWPPASGDPATAAPPAVVEAAPSAVGECTGTHVVQPGENFFRIGFNCGFSLQQMAAANGLAYPYRIYPGQTLRFPAP